MARTKENVQRRLVFGIGLLFLVISTVSFFLVIFKVSNWRLEGFEKEFHAILSNIGFVCLFAGGICLFAARYLQRDPVKRLVLSFILNAVLVFGGIAVAWIAFEVFLYSKYSDVHIGTFISPSRYTFYRKYYQLNELGFRDYSHALRKPAGRTRIVAVGNSLTFGSGVKRLDDLYFEVLERKLQQVYPGDTIETVSIAQKGWNTKDEFEAFRAVGIHYAPDLVVLEYYLNDPESPEIKARKLSQFEENHLLPYPYGRFLYATSFTYFILEQRIRGLSFLEDANGGRRAYIRELYSGDNLKRHKKILREFLAFIRELDLPVIVILFPELPELYNPQYPYSQIHRLVAETVKNAGAEFLDLTGPLKQSGIKDLLVSEFDFHPNEKVHKFAGEKLFEFIKEKKLLPSKQASA